MACGFSGFESDMPPRGDIRRGFPHGKKFKLNVLFGKQIITSDHSQCTPALWSSSDNSKVYNICNLIHNMNIKALKPRICFWHYLNIKVSSKILKWGYRCTKTRIKPTSLLISLWPFEEIFPMNMYGAVIGWRVKEKRMNKVKVDGLCKWGYD